MRWSIPVAFVLLFACADGAAPERRCTAHLQCDEGFLCGADGRCRPSQRCTGDEGCCPGAVCFSGWCRPTPECFAGETCPGLGEVCEVQPGLSIAGATGPLGDPALTGRCVPMACDPARGCPSPLSCVGGRCLLGPPCGGRCQPSEVCDPLSDRCLPTPAAGPCDCGGGWAVATQLGATPQYCGPETYGCTCAALPAVPPGLPGVDGRLVPGAGALPALVSYEPRYGDLVLSRFSDSSGQLRDDIALDGVPAGPAEALGGYRSGVVEPGPDRGARPSVAPHPDGGFDVLYRDLDRQRLMFSRARSDGTRWAIGELALDGLDVGRYSCLARLADGRLAGLAFVSVDATDRVSRLVRLESLVVDPVSGEDWAATPVLETPLPPRLEHPCGDACGFAEQCVVGDGGPMCADIVDINLSGNSSCGTCGPHEVCADIGGARSCRALVYRRYAADRLPFGEGLYVSCAARGAEVFASWYDHDRQRLIAARWPFGPGDRKVVLEGPGLDPGRFASVALDDGQRVGIAFVDAAQATLHWAEAASWSAPFSVEVVPASDGGQPGVGARAFYRFGRPVIVHLDGRSTSVEVAARGAGCWGRRTVLAGGYAYPAAMVGPDGVWVAAQQLAFDDALEPRHAPVMALVAEPDCP